MPQVTDNATEVLFTPPPIRNSIHKGTSDVLKINTVDFSPAGGTIDTTGWTCTANAVFTHLCNPDKGTEVTHLEPIAEDDDTYSVLPARSLTVTPARGDNKNIIEVDFPEDLYPNDVPPLGFISAFRENRVPCILLYILIDPGNNLAGFDGQISIAGTMKVFAFKKAGG